MFVNKEHNREVKSGDYLYSQNIASTISEEGTFISEVGKEYFSTSRLEYTKEGNPVSPTSLGGIIENMESMKIKDSNYQDIMQIYYPNEGTGDWLQEAWYAKNIYLVKFRKSDNTTWNLIKYHIIK